MSKPARHLKLVTGTPGSPGTRPAGQPAGTLPGTGFAWECRKPVTEDGQTRECGASGSDRAEYERHMRGHGLKTAKSAYTPAKPWKPPRPKDYAPGPADPGQRIEWEHVTEGHRDPGDGTWTPETRQARAGIIWSVADVPSAWWVIPDDDPGRPVYVRRAGKRDHWALTEGGLYEVPQAADAARARVIRGNIIRERGIFPVIDSRSPACRYNGPSTYIRWHSDPACPRAAGKERYDPASPPAGTVYGYQPEGRGLRTLGQARWNPLDVADMLTSGHQPPSSLCPNCITDLDITTTPPENDPGAIPDQPEPEPEASVLPVPPATPDTPGPAEPRTSPPEPAAPSPGPARAGWKRRAPVAVRLDHPGTDAGFLASCAQLHQALAALADDIGDWAGCLAMLGLPAPVTGPLRQLADSITAAAAGAAQAAAAFEDEFAGARDVAARGMQFTGRPRA